MIALRLYGHIVCFSCFFLVGAVGAVDLKKPAEYQADFTGQGGIDRVVVNQTEHGKGTLLVKLSDVKGQDVDLRSDEALPWVDDSYGGDGYEGFSVAIAHWGSNVLSVIDVQGEQGALRMPHAESQDVLLLKSNQDGNGVYNYNLVFGYDGARDLVLRLVVLNVNEQACGNGLLSSYLVDSILPAGMSIVRFDGAAAYEGLNAAYVERRGAGRLKKIMRSDIYSASKKAMGFYRGGDIKGLREELDKLGFDSACPSRGATVEGYYFNDSVAWSNDFGFLLSEAGYYRQSIELLVKIIQDHPGRTVAYLNLADSYWGIGDFKSAMLNYDVYAKMMSNAGKASRVPRRVGERLELGLEKRL